MSKPRKMLCDLEAPYTQSLMRLIETQSKATLANWALDYAERHYLPIYAAHFPQDLRPREAPAARDWLAGRVKLPALKPLILAAHAAAREAEAVPPAQAGPRAPSPRLPRRSTALRTRSELASRRRRSGLRNLRHPGRPIPLRTSFR